MEPAAGGEMKTSAIMDLINDLEARYQVDQWTFDGIHVWPFIRIKLSFDLFYRYHVSSPSGGAPQASLPSRALCLVKNNLKFARAVVTDFRKNAWPSKRAEVVFVSDGVSYALLEGSWYEKFCDPLISVLERQQRTTFLISPLHEYLVPRHSPSLFIQPCIDLVKVKNYLLPDSGTASNAFLQEHPDCCAYLAEQKIPASLMDQRMVQAYVRMIQGISRLYCSVLERLKPSLVFLVSYYGIEGMAVNLACRRLSIPSVDIQHGFQGELHIAYARWNKVPVSGYELFPSYYWCWSDSDVETIRKWSAAVDRWHHPVAGGNLWLDMWQQGGQQVIDRYDAVLQNALAPHRDAHHILVSLQPGLSDQTTLDSLLKAITRGKRAWRWWFRLHPCMLQERQQIKDLLNLNGITDFELDLATDLPLYSLLRHLDLHITHSSSTVIEAQQFGIPSVIIHEFGTEFFPDQIRTGWARPAYTTEQILEAIQTQLDAKSGLPQPMPAHHRSPDKTVENMLARILEHKHQNAERY